MIFRKSHFAFQVTKYVISSQKLKLYHNNFVINKSHRFYRTRDPNNYTFSTLSASTQPSLSYSEQALTPNQISQMLLQTLTQSTSKSQILHQLSLYYNKLLTFDYDYFTQALKHLIFFQNQLTFEEIQMIYAMAIEYKIQTPVLTKHLENEIYCRLYTSVRKEIQKYDKQLEKEINDLYKQLEQKSKDHFQLIDQKYKDIFENAQKRKNQSLETKQQQYQELQPQIHPMYQYHINEIKPLQYFQQRKQLNKTFTGEQLYTIANILISSGSKNIDLNKLLLQIFSIRIAKLQAQQQIPSKNKKSILKFNSQFLLLYTKLTINLLQLYMSKIHQKPQNKDRQITKRSLKSIYKLQTFYYYEIAKMIQERNLLQESMGCSKQILLQFINLISQFPIKRRSFRKQIGLKIIQALAKQNMLNIESDEQEGSESSQIQQTLFRLFSLSKYDNKLLQTFQKEIRHHQAKKLGIEAIQKIQEKLQPLTQELIKYQHKSNQQDMLFKIPGNFFKKVTKKKSKPYKNIKKDDQTQQIVIDCTQNSQEQIKEDPEQQWQEQQILRNSSF